MANYKLTRTGDGALDLSQVPDASGRPVVLQRKGDSCVVNELNAKHPLVQRYKGHGLLVEEISLKIDGAPAVPATAPAPPTPAPLPPVTEGSTPAIEPEPPASVPAAAPETPPTTEPAADSASVEPDDKSGGKKSKGSSGKSR